MNKKNTWFNQFWKLWTAEPAQPVSMRAGLSEIADWLATLPLTNSYAAVACLLEVLAEIESLQLAPDATLARLELIHPIACKLSHTLKQQYLRQGGVLVPENWQKNTRVRQLHTQILRLAYVGAVESDEDQGLEVIGRAVQLGLVHATSVLLSSYDSYRPIPEQTWLQVYGLYDTAVRLDITTFNLVSKDSPRSGSIYELFVVLLMLGVCNPYNLTPAELATLFDAMRGWTSKIRLQANPSRDSVFIYSTQFDTPPTYRQFITESQLDDSYRGVDMRALVMGFESLLTELLQSSRPILDDFLPPNLLNHVYNRWRGPSPRASDRKIEQGTYQTIIGLAASSAYFRDKYGFNNSTHLSCIRDQREEEIIQSLSRRNEEQGLQQRLLAEYPELRKGADIFLTAPNYFQPHDWELVNQSEQGICLQRRALEIPFIMSGQIISLNKKNAWYIGVIRWVHHQDETLTIGVEVLSSDGFPILIQNQSQTSTGHCLAGLLSVVPEAANQRSILITPNIGYDEHQDVLLQGQHYGMRARLLNCTEASSFFKLFQYEVKEHLR